MRAARVLSLALLLVVGLAGASHAQYSNATGTFDARIGIAPGELPDKGASLPAELQSIGPDLYVGQLTVAKNADGTFAVSFHGERLVGEDFDNARLNVSATFSAAWVGVKVGSILVGPSLETGVITGIDVAHLLSANINGVGTINGENHRLIARIGPGGSVDALKILKAPGFLR